MEVGYFALKCILMPIPKPCLFPKKVDEVRVKPNGSRKRRYLSNYYIPLTFYHTASIWVALVYTPFIHHYGKPSAAQPSQPETPTFHGRPTNVGPRNKSECF